MLRKKPPFPSDEQLRYMTHFPYPESQLYEFKQSLQHYDKKILGTICAFLNSQGGYIVFGIDDSLRITGIRNDSKSVDKFILDIDRIFHIHSILEVKIPSFLKRENITLREIVHPAGKLFVLDVSPLIGAYYQLADGTSFERLNASNLQKKSGRLYTEEELHAYIRNKEDKIRHKYENYVERLKKKIEALEDKLDAVRQALMD